MLKRFTYLVLVVVAVTFFAVGSAGAEKFELKLAHFVPSPHFFSKYLANWAKELEQKSGGRLVVKVFPGAQMGPPPKYYDLARKGIVDITWHLHGATPGRFPLTELSHLPYVMPSAEVGTKVLNHPDILKYLAKEHKGVKILYLLTHQPGNLHTRKKPVRRTEDMKGLRIRFSSATIKDWVAALGGTPVGVPPTEIADNLQKGTIDGVFIDYGGAHTAFKLGGLIGYTTEMYSYITSFVVSMNPRSYKRLPRDLQQLIDTTTSNVAGPIGKLWDDADAPGRAYLIREGGKTILLSPEEDAKFKRIAQKVIDKKISALEKKGLPARAVYNRMKELADEYGKTSKNFWKGHERR